MSPNYSLYKAAMRQNKECQVERVFVCSSHMDLTLICQRTRKRKVRALFLPLLRKAGRIHFGLFLQILTSTFAAALRQPHSSLEGLERIFISLFYPLFYGVNRAYLSWPLSLLSRITGHRHLTIVEYIL